MRTAGLRLLFFFALAAAVFAIFGSALVLPSRLVRLLVPILLRLNLGLFIREKNKHYLTGPGRSPIVVMNHETDVDAYVMGISHLARPIISTTTTTIPLLGSVLKHGYRAWDPIWVPPKSTSEDSRNYVRDTILAHLNRGSNVPVCIAAEGGLTNGRHALMMFKRFVFSLGFPVTPVALRHVDNWFIEPDFFGSTWLSNMLWMNFFPYHEFELTWLALMPPLANEAPEAFAKRVQLALAAARGIGATDFPYEAKVKLRDSIYGTRQRAY